MKQETHRLKLQFRRQLWLGWRGQGQEMAEILNYRKFGLNPFFPVYTRLSRKFISFHSLRVIFTSSRENFGDGLACADMMRFSV